MNQLKIIMLGESLQRQGGIVTVEKLILQQANPNLQITHIATLPNGSTARKVVVFGQAIGELLWRLLRREGDLVHIHVSERGSAFRKAILTLIAYMFRKPVIIHAHSADFHLFYSQLPQWIKQGLSWVFGRSECFIVLSESWKNFYINNLGLKTEQVVVLPNPVKLPSQVPHRIHRDKVSFVFLGRIGQRKGTFDLIRAFSLLPAEQKTKSELVVAGDGDVEQARRLVESLNLVEYITVLDWIDSAQRDALLAKADVFVLPSYNEGLPMALIEAMSWGLPVVTTPVGGIPELVTHTTNGLLVNPGNIQQLSEAMQSLLKDENMRLSLGRNARLSVIHLDVEKYLNSLLCIYCAMLDSRKQGYVKTLPN